jgi:hypothetical protein
MAKFNKQNTIEHQMTEHLDAISNYEGGLSFSVDPLTELYLRAATCLVGEPKFYESANFADQELIRATHEVLKTNPEYVLQLAVYCREQMHLRSVPLVLCAEYANVASGTVPGARKYISRVIQRADELSEIIAYQLERNKISPRKTKLPMAIKAGVAGAFPKFDLYQLGKYNRDGIVKLRDALFLTHPIPKNDQQKADWDNLAAGTLESPITWETQRSSGLMTWHDVIHNIFNKDGKVNNYMAQLRNLRNVLQSEYVTNDDITLICNMLSDREAVRRSKQLPFRFLSAYRIVKELEHPRLNSVMDALEDAAHVSVENIPKMAGTTLIACDVSGSMNWEPISKNSSVFPYDIGIMLGSMAHQFCDNSITGIFGAEWKQISMSKRSGILSNVSEMHRYDNEVRWATNGYKVIDYLIDNNIKVDRLMIFTDCQMWDSHDDRNFAPTFIKYQRMYPDVKLYLFDLSGYGNIVIPQDTKNICLVAGWSDRVFDFIQMFEGTGTSAIEKIRAITP